MKPKLIVAILASLLVLLVAAPVGADDLDGQVRAIAKKIQCPVCESVNVADSPAELAVQMRGVIRAKLEAGESEAQILDYFVNRYGDSILVEPPRRGVSLLVWIGPILAALGGGVILAVWLRRARRRADPPTEVSAAAPTASSSTDLETARRELASLRGAPEP